ncbi:2-dehydro-3-deoxygalactonokinase [Clostridium sp. AF18-27]|uniref:2-dehydro-3-deoxygalactonokinase n=1 Tax=Enterocloster lavalensis TaxID=460384 RepID=A0A1I0BSJ2_9FIRM|nr:2-dehydro-3-deoxygalactonokinase [Enterocloster lavalensis]PST32277.1 2-dehydro-3-deoxygalactonokinase [Enterocloster lavalensis]RHR57310.1 2-dehydro-3-deoxygalactonokinase [Clostridium sp. AF18-27]SET09345.1 2-dehydro-3-deoxygalactonokinase [Enterocloster lavalensis]
MKSYIITIDTGTTNTRTFLWDENRNMIAGEKAEVGVRNTAIDGNNDRLKKAVHDCLERLLENNNLTYNNISRVMACGMITSNVGLVEVPHVTAPAGLKELAQQAKSILLEDVCPLPILFIPGVKNGLPDINMENFAVMDIMRGEEVESIAIMDHFPKDKPYLLVLPGSHTKFVSVDKEGKMTGCLTTITGELLASITNDTIIADAVGRQFVNEADYDREMMLKGFVTSRDTGIGHACFSARILNMFVEKDKMKLANYILGVALQNDITAIKNSKALETDQNTTVIVSGKNPLRQAIIDILIYDGYFADVEEFVPDNKLPLSAAGAYLVADAMNR